MRDVLFSLLIIYILSTPLTAFAKKIDLPSYISHVLIESNEALNIQSDISLSGYSQNLAEQGFEIEWTPNSQASKSNNSDSASIGIEANRRTTWGPEFTVGVKHAFVGEDITTNYAEVNLGLFREWGSRYIRSPLTSAEIQHNQTLLNAVKRKQELISKAISSYYQVLESNLLLKQSEDAVSRASRNLDVAKSRQILGLTDKVDVYRAQLSLLNSKESYKRQQRTYTRSLRSYRELMGPDADDANIVNNLRQIHVFYPDAWEERIFSLNIDWQIHLLDKQTSELGLYVAERNTLPDLELFVAADKQYQQDALLNDDHNWTIGLRVSSTLGLKREKSLLSQERIRHQQLKRRDHQLKRDILAEMHDSLDEYDSLLERFRIATAKLAQSQRSLELTSLRFQRGVSSNLDQIEAQESLNQAEIDVVQQQIDLSLQAVKIALTLGVLTPEWLNMALNQEAALNQKTAENTSEQKEYGPTQ